MAEIVAGLLTSAFIKIAIYKISSAIAEQGNLLLNFSGDLEAMKDTLESVAAVLKDAEKRSLRDDSVLLWLKRLKHFALDVSDMMNDYQETKKQATAKLPGILSCLPITRKIVQLANEMKNMREKLREINEQRQMLNFAPNTVSSLEQQHYDQRATTSSDINEAQVIGREGEKQAIIDLLSANHRKDGTMIVPIYGLGGIGKSTLAQLVYNDTRSKKYDYQAWVYVSREFDLKKIGRSVISQISTGGGQQNTDALQLIDRCLDNLLLDKKILIVLDDIWEEKESELDKLKAMLRGRKGSMVDVILTTRSEYIAQTICTNEPYKLPPLKDPMCWDIIKKYSNFENKSNREQLEQIGLDIAKKCGGVALAAKALGYMLKSKDMHGWSEMNNSDLWNESSGVDNSPLNSVHASLMLSYEWMPPILRLCFSYCAIFPKGRDIIEDDLIYQWVALDFIKPSEGKERLKQLMGMSFLQDSKLPSNASAVLKDAMLVSSDDLTYGFARYVLGDGLIVVDGRNGGAVRSSNAYLAVVSNWDANQQLDLSNILPARILALRFEDCPAKMELSDGVFVFSSAKHLLVLDLSGCSLKKLPESIGQLKRLRYLNAPGIQDRVLPVCLTRLHWLRYLSLRGSPLLTDLTEAFGRLYQLQHLDLSGCSGLKALPDSFGTLYRLQHLDLSGCSGLKALPNSLYEVRHLDLSGCSGLRALPNSLNRLKHLDLSGWSCVGGITEALQRYQVDLQYLNLSHRCGYSSVEDWFHLKDLDKVLRKQKELGFLGLSSCLNPLCYTSTPDKSKDYVDHCIRDLVKLQHLDLSHNKFLVQLPESMGNLKELRSLDLSGCFRLKSLPESIGGLKEMCTLNLSGCFRLDRLPERIGELKKLETLDLSGCTQFGPDNVQQMLAELLTQGSLTIITDHHQAQGSASTPQKMPRSSIRLLLQSQRLLRLLMRICSPVAVIPLPLLSAVFLFSVLAYFGCLLIPLC